MAENFMVEEVSKMVLEAKTIAELLGDAERGSLQGLIYCRRTFSSTLLYAFEYCI